MNISDLAKLDLQTPRKSIIRRTLAPGEIAIVNALGTFFYLTEAEGPLAVGMGNDTPERYDVGTGYIGDARSNEGFTSLRLENLSTETNSVEIIVGFGEFRDNRFTLVASRNFALPVYEPSTTIRGTGGMLAANTSISLSPVPVAPETRRKMVTLCNGSSELRLQVLDAAGNIVLVVFPETSIALPVSESLTLRNPHGVAVEYYISEVWWNKP